MNEKWVKSNGRLKTAWLCARAALSFLRHLYRRQLPILLALAAGHLAPAAADHSFTHATDLGVATEWDATGREFLGTIEDVEGADEQYLKFQIQVEGPILVWTTDAFNPSLRLFDSTQMPVTGWRSSHYLHPADAGVYYIVASSSRTGRYRLHVAGGGEGHDDVGNVHETAMVVTPTQGSEETPLGLYRLDFWWDRDFFRFKIPPVRRVGYGHTRPVRPTQGLGSTSPA